MCIKDYIPIVCYNTIHTAKHVKLTILDDIRYEAGYFYSCEGKSKPVAYAMATCATIGSYINRVVCYFKDHEWIDDSVAGPDSGNMDMYCERCGKSFHYTLY